MRLVARIGSLVVPALLVTAGCQQQPFKAYQQSRALQRQQQLQQQQLAQQREYEQRARQLDSNNQDLHAQFAKSQQQAQLFKDEIRLVRKQLRETTDQLAEARRTNQEVAKLFSNIGDLLEIKGENRFKVLAYRKAADNIGHLGQDLFDLWQSGTDLRSIEGIGQAIADKIDELFSTGKLGFWEKLTVEVPESLVDVLAIPDVGPKLAQSMWQELDFLDTATG